MKSGQANSERPAGSDAGFFRLALVGAPGAGKTTGLPVVRSHARSRGFVVRTVPEAATLILRTLKPTDPRHLGPEGIRELQRMVFRLQLNLETAAGIAPDKRQRPCVILTDRGVMDGEVYLGSEPWARLLAEEGADPASLLARYDAVIHLGTAAALNADAYQAVGVRAEDRAFALELETRAREIWGRHPRYVFVPAYEQLDEKWAMLRAVFDQVLPPA